MIPPVKKAVILCAGLGTRFFPMTKVVPKAMLPLVDRPIIQHLVEEAVASGINEILIVRGPNQEVIEEHFRPNPVLEKELRARGRMDALASIQTIGENTQIFFAVQEHALGDGHALMFAKDFVGSEPFAVLFGDDVIDSIEPGLKQLLKVYDAKGSTVLACEPVPREKIGSYGVVEPGEREGRLATVKGLVEKPQPEDAPSNLGVVGKYVCTNDVLAALETAEAGHADQELRLIDAFIVLLKEGKNIHALEMQGDRYDTGKPEGLLQANIRLSQGVWD